MEGEVLLRSAIGCVPIIIVARRASEGEGPLVLTQVRQLLRRKHPEFVVSPLFLAILPLQVENV
jgi:hypothetical protein